MAGFHVNSMKANLGSFSRAYLFNVYFTNDVGVGVARGDNIATYLVRSTTLPESTIEPIVVPWQGQEYKMGSTHTFAEWECTFNLDSNATLRKQMVEWSRKVHDPETNIHGSPSDYYGEAVLELLDVNGAVVMAYTLHQAWPSSIGSLDLAQDNKEVSQFSVTFTYNWFTTI